MYGEVALMLTLNLPFSMGPMYSQAHVARSL